MADEQFLRLGTNPAFPGTMSDDEAIGWIEEWLDAGVEVVSDADVRGATLASFDDDFQPFVAHGLRWDRLTS